MSGALIAFLIFIILLVAGFVIAGFLTNWFGLASEDVVSPPVPPAPSAPPAPPATNNNNNSTVSPSINSSSDKFEVFHLKGYQYTYPQGIEACKLYNNSVLATKTQLEDAHKNGAHWWSAGWIADLSGGRVSQYPLQQSGEGVINGINTFGATNTDDVTSKAGVNCYGKKPADTTDNRTKIAEFNTNIGKWSQFS
jgi:hypothetical protein